MTQTIGESREQWGMDVWNEAEKHANALKHDREPFYIVYAAKQDRKEPGKFRQAFRFYRQIPPKILGLLVWKVDHPKGIFELVPELSLPPDVPVDPTLLSEKKEDSFTSIMEVGEKMGVLLS